MPEHPDRDHRPAAIPGLSRRRALVPLGVGSLAGALALSRFSAGAQEGTPAVADLPPALQEYVAGWEALDPDQIASAYAEDAVHEDVPTGTTIQGREAIRAYLVELFAAFEDASAEITTIFATGDQAAAEWQFSGRYAGQVPGFPPGAGQEIRLRGANIIALEGGQIQRVAEYYDVYGLLVQLGVLPPPGVTGTPVATPAA